MVYQPTTLWNHLTYRLMKITTVLLHPVFIFVVLQIVSVSLTVIWVIWYVKQSSVRLLYTYDVAFFITGCVLTGIILLGTVLLFVFAIKQKSLNFQQRSFVSSVTHELRSPIASMQLSLETIDSHQLDQATVSRLSAMIRSDMDRLVNLVDQILVSARLDRGIKIFDEIESFALDQLITKAIDNASHLDQEIQKRVHVKCPDDLTLYTSRSAVALVVSNLLENAIKYSPSKTPISIDAEQNTKEITLRFADQGFGLDKRDQKKIFKIFHRGDIAAKKAIPGTGLGLYIVRSVVKVLGGRVWAESPGRGLGSTFIVKLPIQDSGNANAGLT